MDPSTEMQEATRFLDEGDTAEPDGSVDATINEADLVNLPALFRSKNFSDICTRTARRITRNEVKRFHRNLFAHNPCSAMSSRVSKVFLPRYTDVVASTIRDRCEQLSREWSRAGKNPRRELLSMGRQGATGSGLTVKYQWGKHDSLVCAYDIKIADQTVSLVSRPVKTYEMQQAFNRIQHELDIESGVFDRDRNIGQIYQDARTFSGAYGSLVRVEDYSEPGVIKVTTIYPAESHDQ